MLTLPQWPNPETNIKKFLVETNLTYTYHDESVLIKIIIHYNDDNYWFTRIDKMHVLQKYL